MLEGVRKEFIRFAGRGSSSSSSSLMVRSMTREIGRLLLPARGMNEVSREDRAIGETDEGVVSPLILETRLSEISMTSSRSSYSSSESGIGEFDASTATDQRPSTSIVTDSTLFGVLFKMSRKYLKISKVKNKTGSMRV